ncbi:hypothetical protein PC116_g19129 [Phytophthora cactorum]|nr:hypothetical protein Pcac1_g19493 [Phytophthora cactorum]KAG4232630.1 hypothetical protein PC116_g19129 [Phytophthora cactorum]
MPETVERTETVETLETVETTEKANPSETSDKFRVSGNIQQKPRGRDTSKFSLESQDFSLNTRCLTICSIY